MQGIQEPGFPGDSRKLSRGSGMPRWLRGPRRAGLASHVLGRGVPADGRRVPMPVEHLMKAIDHLSSPLRLGEIT